MASHSSAALLDNGPPQWATPQYPPRPTNRIHGTVATESTAVGEGSYDTPGPYGTPYAEPWTQKPSSDSPKFNVHLPLQNDIQPRSSSRPWWQMVLVKSRRRARFAYATSLIVVLAIWILVNTVFTMRERNHQTKYSKADLKEKLPRLQQLQNANADANGPMLFVFLRGHLRGFSADKSTLTVDWEGMLVDPQLNDLHLGATPDVRYNLAIFKDVSTERDNNTEILLTQFPNTTEAQYQQFQVFQPAPPPVGYIGRSPADSISTEISVGELEGSGILTQPNFAYPYDRSQGQISFAMSNNNSVNFYNTSKGTFLVPITGAVITDAIMNYQVDISNTAPCSDGEGCHVNITLELQRPGLVKTVVISTVIINWLITLSICILTGEAILLQRVYILSGSDILSICLTSLFALPSVRSVLPGAPPFGCLLDMVGILPNIILISICTTAFAVAKAKNHLREGAQDIKREK